MATLYKQSREAVRDAIEARRNDLVITDFTLIATATPLRYWARELENTPLVHVASMGFDESRTTRGGFVDGELFVQTSVLSKITYGDTGEPVEDDVEELLSLREQISAVCRGVSFCKFAWLRNEDMRDESGLPYSYELFRESNSFAGYINSTFQGVRK